MSGVHCGFITRRPPDRKSGPDMTLLPFSVPSLSMLSDDYHQDHMTQLRKRLPHLCLKPLLPLSIYSMLLFSWLSYFWRLPWGTRIGTRDQIETRSTRLSVRPDTGLTARVIMQPVRNQFELLKFPPSLAEKSGWLRVAVQRAEAGGRHSGSAAHPSLTSSAHLWTCHDHHHDHRHDDDIQLFQIKMWNENGSRKIWKMELDFFRPPATYEPAMIISITMMTINYQ